MHVSLLQEPQHHAYDAHSQSSVVTVTSRDNQKQCCKIKLATRILSQMDRIHCLHPATDLEVGNNEKKKTNIRDEIVQDDDDDDEMSKEAPLEQFKEENKIREVFTGVVEQNNVTEMAPIDAAETECSLQTDMDNDVDVDSNKNIGNSSRHVLDILYHARFDDFTYFHSPYFDTSQIRPFVHV